MSFLKPNHHIFFLFVLCMLTDCYGEAKEQFRGQCYSNFFGFSTNGPFSGHVQSKPFSAIAAKSFSWDVEVAIEEMTTNHSVMDKKMYHMFESNRYPTIKGSFKDVNLDQKTTRFYLNIQNRSKPIEAVISQVTKSAKTTTFMLDFTISLKSFGLKAPSFLGIMRVYDKVKVKSNFTLTKDQA